jgi:hypothetical protein
MRATPTDAFIKDGKPEHNRPPVQLWGAHFLHGTGFSGIAAASRFDDTQDANRRRE